MSVDSNGPDVIVVSAGGTGDPAPAPGPVYVTPGELDARLELLRNEFQQSVATVAEVAVDALVTASDAQDTADMAEAHADVAAEVAVEAVETAVEAAEPEPETTGPKPAEPHQEQPAKPANEKHAGYGHPGIYKR